MAIHQNPELSFNEYTLAFRVNGRCIMECLNGILDLPNGKQDSISEENVAANGLGYINSKLLRQIFGLDHI